MPPFLQTLSVAWAAPFLCAALGAWLASLAVRRMETPAHWTVLALALWPARMVSGVLPVTLPLIQTMNVVLDSRPSAPPAWAVLLVGFAGTIMGLRLGRWRTPQAPAAEGSSIWPSPVFLLLFHFGTVVLVGMLLLNTGRPFGRESLLIAGVGLALLLAWHLGLTLWIMKTTGLMRPAPASLAALAQEQSTALGIPAGQVYEMDMPMSNAFALPWTRELAFTTRIGRVLDSGELKSVIAHELGHLAEPPGYRWARLLHAFQLTALGLIPSMIISYQFPGAFAVFMFHFLLQKFRLALSRKAELAADRTALGAEADPAAYARALEKIHADNLIPAVLGGNETHPDLWIRLTKAGVTPDYPLPAPPPKSLWITITLLAAGLLVLLNYLI